MADAGRSAAFRSRMLAARLAFSASMGAIVGQVEITDRANKYLHRTPLLTTAAVSRYFGGRIPGDLVVIEALAWAMQVDCGWLAFGERTRAPAPPGWVPSPASDNPRPAEDADARAVRELEEIHRVAEQEKRDRQKRGKAHRRRQA